MPQLIEHIDKIARDKGRDVLCVVFDSKVFWESEFGSRTVREELIEWFNQNNIEVFPCAGLAHDNAFESYRGQLYIDVPYDENHPDYLKICALLENEDGSPRIEGAIFSYCPLELAMKNKHHDEPGYWEKWVDKF